MNSQPQPTATLVTGATGFVGKKLLPKLEHPVVVSRSLASAKKKLSLPDNQIIEWDPQEKFPITHSNTHFRQVVNLMGDPIAHGRWNEDKKKRIRDSRVVGTRNLIDGLIERGQLPDVFVSASAIGFYGDSGEGIVEESHQKGSGFLPDVCEEWEHEALRFEEHGVRVVCLRIGIVLGADGGAISEMAPLFRWCLGGNLGNGKQWMAWVHVDDLVNLIHFSVENDSLHGPVNATAPTPVRNSEFTKTLANAVGRPAILPAPRFALRLALGEFADSLYFSQRVVPKAALDAGFKFEFADVAPAIQHSIR